MEGTDLILMDNESVGLMLEPGENRVIPSKEFESPIGCGLIPLGINKCRLATAGYKWNLGNISKPYQYGELSFGNFISTSNEIVSDFV